MAERIQYDYTEGGNRSQGGDSYGDVHDTEFLRVALVRVATQRPDVAAALIGEVSEDRALEIAVHDHWDLLREEAALLAAERGGSKPTEASPTPEAPEPLAA